MVIDDASPPGAWARDLARRPAVSERDVQRQVIQLLSVKGYLVTHVPNGIPVLADTVTRARVINTMKKDGLRPGFPDLLVFSRQGGVGCIEVKRPGKRNHKNAGLEADQLWWKDELVKRGINWARIDCLDDVDTVLRGWGWAQ